MRRGPEVYNLEMYPQVIQPEQASFLLQFLLPQLKSEQAITHKILSAVPPDREIYRPDLKSMTALELANHIAVVEIWFLEGVITKRFEGTVRPPNSLRTCGDVCCRPAGSGCQGRSTRRRTGSFGNKRVDRPRPRRRVETLFRYAGAHL